MAVTSPSPIAFQPVIRLTGRGRAVLLMALVLAAFMAFSIARFNGQAGTSYTGPATATVTVHPGQTLWQIARAAAPGDDPRDTTDRIRSLNGLGSSVVQAGQRLIVPR